MQTQAKTKHGLEAAVMNWPQQCTPGVSLSQKLNEGLYLTLTTTFLGEL